MKAHHELQQSWLGALGSGRGLDRAAKMTRSSPEPRSISPIAKTAGSGVESSPPNKQRQTLGVLQVANATYG
jgi:hypothetical protein